MSHDGWAAGEADGDAGPELYPFGVFGNQHAGEEGVVLGFGCPHAVEADFLGSDGYGGNILKGSQGGDFCV
jgi:hypothetical protein